MSTRDGMTRRVVLHRGVLLASAAAVPGPGGRQPLAGLPAGAPRSRGRPCASPDRVLVVIQLRGGNDGLNTVIPVRNDLYYACRPRLSIRREAALKINDGCSFHPALVGLKSLYDEGLVAIVRGAGYPHPNRSHLKSMDIWETASPQRQTKTGWLGRCFDVISRGTGKPVSEVGIALTSDPPLAMCGDVFRPALLQPAEGGCRPPLAASLQTVGRLVASDRPTRVYYVSQGGYDTHVGQGHRHPQLLGQLGRAIRDFVSGLRATHQLDRVLVMVFSEFGRRVAENISGGTDHGEAGVMFVIGGGVRPGLYGRGPDLERLHRGDLAWTTDFRGVYAAILRDWLGLDPESVLGEAIGPLPIIRPADERLSLRCVDRD